MQYKTYLAHHGVKGMKWGRRKDRYYDRQSAHIRSKSMSDDDLHAANVRMNKERKYRQNIRDEYLANRSTASAFVDSGKSVMNDAQTSTNAGANLAKMLGNRKRSKDTSFSTQAKSMSDAELRSAINRMDMERRYVSLKQNEITTGYDRAATILTASGYVLASAAGALGIVTTLKYLKHAEVMMNTNELYHHGVKGMRWGRRKTPERSGGNKRFSRLERAANAAYRDADNLEKHGYKKEAAAVRAVGDKNLAKANLKNIKRTNNTFRSHNQELRKVKKQAKIDRKARDRAIQDKYDKTIEKIESSYKKGQNLSERDLRRQEKADNDAMTAWKKSKDLQKMQIKSLRVRQSVDRGKILVDRNQTYGKVIAKGIAKQTAFNVGINAVNRSLIASGQFGAAAAIAVASVPVSLIMSARDVAKIYDIHSYNTKRYSR